MKKVDLRNFIGVFLEVVTKWFSGHKFNMSALVRICETL